MLPDNRLKEIKSKIKPTVSEYDVIILGAGPGGLTAGLYLCQSKINTVLVDIALPGDKCQQLMKFQITLALLNHRPVTCFLII